MLFARYHYVSILCIYCICYTLIVLAYLVVISCLYTASDFLLGLCCYACIPSAQTLAAVVVSIDGGLVPSMVMSLAAPWAWLHLPLYWRNLLASAVMNDAHAHV